MSREVAKAIVSLEKEIGRELTEEEALKVQAASQKGELGKNELSTVVLAGLIGISLTSFPAEASSGIADKLAKAFFKKFEKFASKALGSIFDEMNGLFEQETSKKISALAKGTDSINETARKIFNEQLAAKTAPAPGECDLKETATQQSKANESQQKISEKINKDRGEKIAKALKSDDPTTMREYAKTVQETVSAIARSYPGSNAATVISNSASSNNLKPQQGRKYFTQSEIERSKALLDTVFMPSYEQMKPLPEPTNPVAVESTVRQMRSVLLHQEAACVFEKEHARYVRAGGAASAAEAEQKEVEATYYSTAFRKELEFMTEPAPILKSIATMQASNNKHQLERLDEVRTQNRLLASLLASKG